MPLAPGTYRLNIMCKDVVGSNMGSYETAITVPRLDGDKLSSSTLILAGQFPQQTLDAATKANTSVAVLDNQINQTTSTIRLKDGETNILAGLIRKDSTKVKKSVPFLGESGSSSCRGQADRSRRSPSTTASCRSCAASPASTTRTRPATRCATA